MSKASNVSKTTPAHAPGPAPSAKRSGKLRAIPDVFWDLMPKEYREQLEALNIEQEDIRMNDLGEVEFPLALETSDDPRMIGAWIPEIQVIGRHLRVQGSSDAALNGNVYRVVGIVAGNPVPPRLIMDVTASRDFSNPTVVRHISMPTTKLRQAHSSAGGLRLDTLNQCLLGASNFPAAAAKAGLDPSTIQSLDVRPHPDVCGTRCWRDVPLLAAKLGRGWTYVTGFNIFGALSQPHVVDNCIFTTEAICVLKSPTGTLIDVSPDLAAVAPDHFKNGLGGEDEIPQAKLFIPDPDLTIQKYEDVRRFVQSAVSCGISPVLNDEEEVVNGTEGVNSGVPTADDFIAQGFASEHTKVTILPFHDACVDLTNRAVCKNAAEVMELHAKNSKHTMLMTRPMALAIARRVEEMPDSSVGIIHNTRDPWWSQNVCSSCHVRTMEKLLCAGCGKARYCSPTCQRVHWDIHKHQCAPPEERARRRAAAAAAKKEREEQLRRHADREALEAAEAKHKDAERRRVVAEARLRAAEEAQRALEQRIFEARPRAPAGKKKKAGKDTTGGRLAHAAWDSVQERLVRHEAAEARKNNEHADKVARDAKALVTGLKQLAATASAAHEAAVHVVPPQPTLGQVMGELALD